MGVGIQNGFQNGQNLGFFSKEPFEKRPVIIIQISDLYSDDYFASLFFWNGLYNSRALVITTHCNTLCVCVWVYVCVTGCTMREPL